MKLVNWNPNNDIFDIFNHFDHYFNSVVNNEYNYNYKKPNALIDEDDKFYFLSLEMPGVDKKNIDINIDDGRIIVQSEKIKEKDNLMYSEIDNCSYRRSFYIPDDAQTNKIKAKSINGILKIEIPKLKKAKKDIKKIEIS